MFLNYIDYEIRISIKKNILKSSNEKFENKREQKD